MKRTPSALAAVLLLVLLPALALLSGCGGSASSDGGRTQVNVSLAATTPYEGPEPIVGALAAPSRPTGLPDHAWITVTRVALLPGDGTGGSPDPGGEPAVDDGASPPDGGPLSTALPAPAEVDLLALPAGGAALFLDAFDNVPAGTYRKVRLYYTDPKVHFPGDADNTAVHATANYHLDLHFTGAGLVIPAATDRDVRIVDVKVVFVLGAEGLKVTVNPSKILMRPQAFCTAGPVKYMIRGTADNVDGGAAAFDLLTSSGRSFPVRWGDGTAWSWVDDRTVPSRSVAVPPSAGAASLRSGALVAGVGTVSSGTFRVEWLGVTFPAVRADNVLLPFGAGDSFVLGTPLDNVAVFPAPSKTGARYDDLATLSAYAAGYDLVLPGTFVTARGYAAASGIDAYWISLGP